MKQVLFLLLISLLTSSCRSLDRLTIIRLPDGKIVGQDSSMGRYRNMVLGCDEAKGRLAVIEWGDFKSTIKVFDFTAGTFTKRRVPIGRSNGLSTPEYYDFDRDEFIFHDHQGLHFFGKSSKRRDVACILPEGFWGGTIVPCEDGLLIKCGNSIDGKQHDTVVYRYQQSRGSIVPIYRSSESVRAIFGRNDRAVLVEDNPTDHKNRRLITIDLDGKVLSETNMRMHTADRLTMEGGTIYELYGDGVCRLQYLNLDQGGSLQEIQFPGVSDDLTARFDVKGNLAVIGGTVNRDSSRGMNVTILNIETKQVQKRFKDKSILLDLALVRFNGTIYCILTN